MAQVRLKILILFNKILAQVGASLLALALLGAGCGGGGAGNSRVPPPIAGPDGKPAEVIDFEAQNIDGTDWRLSHLRGKVVLVWFFTTWCGPCMGDAPLLDDLMNGEAAIPDFVVVGVSVDLQGGTLVGPWRDALGVRFPLVLGDKGMLQGRTPFGPLPAVPTACLLDSKGRFVEGFVGPLPLAYVARRARALNEGAR